MARLFIGTDGGGGEGKKGSVVPSSDIRPLDLVKYR